MVIAPPPLRLLEGQNPLVQPRRGRPHDIASPSSSLLLCLSLKSPTHNYVHLLIRNEQLLSLSSGAVLDSFPNTGVLI